MSSLSSTWIVFSLLTFILLFHFSTPAATFSEIENSTPVIYLTQRTMSCIGSWIESFVVSIIKIGVIGGLLYLTWTCSGDETSSKKGSKQKLKNKEPKKLVKEPKKPDEQEKDLKQIDGSKNPELTHIYYRSLTSCNRMDTLHGRIVEDIGSYPSEGELEDFANDVEFLKGLTDIVAWRSKGAENVKTLEQMAFKEYTFPIFQTIARYLLTKFKNMTTFKMKLEDHYELEEFKMAIKLYLILTFHDIQMPVNTQHCFQKVKPLIVQWARLVIIDDVEDLEPYRVLKIKSKTAINQFSVRLTSGVKITGNDVMILHVLCRDLMLNYLDYDMGFLRELQKPEKTVNASILKKMTLRFYKRYDPNRLPLSLRKIIQEKLTEFRNESNIIE